MFVEKSIIIQIARVQSAHINPSIFHMQPQAYKSVGRQMTRKTSGAAARTHMEGRIKEVKILNLSSQWYCKHTGKTAIAK